ncbi:tRNA pseudouridine(38-40) synthase TruA [Candidatus Soleaferrea massiliensis]|uniref:tRNA pseudouridine(38-40) synthase TruA n=1 Tax=Candidatus Soleaferrea massiliensis TaxID=1470354 RepID=UPI000AD51F96|nr:tRNA pseudouridine(38-40) synthase TruA [Candidatus Soleaferrea massiliensis]
MMRNLRFKLAYNGARYHGFQVQQNAPTVCGAFQDALERLTGARHEVKGCSRTDAGVHANRFTLNMKTGSKIPCGGFVKALNNLLPDDIAVLSCDEVPMDFHARYDCRGKRYLYRIRNSGVRSPFLISMCHLYARPIDEAQLHRAAKAFVGTHDFAAFCASGSDVEDTVRTVYDCSVSRSGEMVTVSITGDGFLYNMVRIIVGTLLEVAEGRIPAQQLPDIIASGERARAGRTAPACGLYLDEVFYDETALR